MLLNTISSISICQASMEQPGEPCPALAASLQDPGSEPISEH